MLNIFSVLTIFVLYLQKGVLLSTFSKEFSINSKIVSDSSSPQIASIGENKFVIAWQRFTTWDYDIYFKIVDGDGKTIRNETIANSMVSQSENQLYSRIGVLENNDFVIIWTSYTDPKELFGQKFNNNGELIGSAFQITVSYGVVGNANFVKISDGYLISWQEYKNNNQFGIAVQKYDSELNPIGEIRYLTKETTGYQTCPSIVKYKEGFILVYQNFFDEAFWAEIHLQQFDSNMTKIGDEKRINTHRIGDQQSPQIKAVGNNFIVAWRSWGQENDYTFDLYGQILDESLSKIGNEFRINQEIVGYQWKLDIESYEDRFIAVYNSPKDGNVTLNQNYVFARTFDSFGTPMVDEFPVSTNFGDINQGSSSVSLSKNGFFVVYEASFEKEEEKGEYYYGVVGSIHNNQCNNVCDEGYTIYSNLIECVCVCQENYFPTNSSSNGCSKCENGYYRSDLSQSTCSSCPTGTTSVFNEEHSGCICLEGFFFNENSNSCKECPANFYKSRIGNDRNCSACPLHSTTQQQEGASKCICDSQYFSIQGNCVSQYIVLGIIIGGVGGCIILVFVLLFFFFFCCFCCRIKKIQKKANRFDHIDGIDIIAKEIELEQKETSKPKIKCSKESYIIDFKEIELVQLIGEGGSGTSIYKSEWNGETVVYKAFRVSSSFFQVQEETETAGKESEFLDFEKELSICTNIHHPSILQFFGACIAPPKVGLILEFCEFGDIPNFIHHYRKKKGTKYPMKKKIRIIKEIVYGMEYLHSRSIIHRDLKPENVLINGQEKSKITDFGLSKLKTNNEEMTRCIGTSFYMSPEVYNKNNYSFEADVYSFSFLVFVLITENFYPFSVENLSCSVAKLVKDPNFRPEIKEEDFGECKFLISLIQKNWKHDPFERNSFSEIKSILKNK